MNETNPYSDEFINAFIDNELSARERAELLSAASASRDLSQRICQIQCLKEMLKTAYPEENYAESIPEPPRQRPWVGYAAVALIGALSLFFVIQPLETLFLQEGAITESLDLQQAGGLEAGVSRVIFHVSSDDAVVAENLLDQVEIVLHEYADSDRPIRVEVVANNQGLRLFQQGRSPFSERIAYLHSRFQNIVFAACGNTLERMRKETGEVIAVLPQAVIIRSGILFVARRQQQGWAYIKV